VEAVIFEVVPVLLFLGPCWLLAGLFYFFGMRPHLRSARLGILNGNLKTIGKFWSNSTGAIVDLSEDAIERDREKYIRSFLIFTAVLSLFSVLGMILLGLIFMTSRSRLEIQIFNSRLVSEPDLSAERIHQTLEEVRALV